MILASTAVSTPPPLHAAAVAVAPPRCLVVTGDRRLRESIRIAAAVRAGFECDAPATAAEIDHLGGVDHRLVFIDLTDLVGPLRRRAILVAAERSRCRATLVVICGAGRDDEEERLAARLGVGLFLPGVSIATAVNCVIAEFMEPRSATAAPA
jgi:hypothetical protein